MIQSYSITCQKFRSPVLLAGRIYTDYQSNWKTNQIIAIFSSCKELQIFWHVIEWLWIISISHSPRPLAAGPILNASNMESLLSQVIRNYYLDSMRLIGYGITVMLVKSWQYDVELPVLTSWIMEPLKPLMEPWFTFQKNKFEK